MRGTGLNPVPLFQHKLEIRMPTEKIRKPVNINKRAKYFRKQFNKGIELLGMSDYHINFYRFTGGGNRAQCEWHGINHRGDPRQITISYSTKWLGSDDTTKKEIRTAAYHEVMEALLCKLRDFSSNTELAISPREVDGEVHKIIRIFENRILPHLPK